MNEPLIERILRGFCVVLGHRPVGTHWYHAGKRHQVCGRCSRIVSRPIACGYQPGDE